MFNFKYSDYDLLNLQLNIPLHWKKLIKYGLA